MSDIKINNAVLLKKLEVRREEMRLNLSRMELRLLELDDERAKIQANQDATNAEIARLDNEIKEIREVINNG